MTVNRERERSFMHGYRLTNGKIKKKIYKINKERAESLRQEVVKMRR